MRANLDGGTDISWLGNRDLRPYRSEIQMIFSGSALHEPTALRRRQVIKEPLLIQGAAARRIAGAVPKK